MLTEPLLENLNLFGPVNPLPRFLVLPASAAGLESLQKDLRRLRHNMQFI